MVPRRQLLFFLSALMGCGAPTKKASEVGYLFAEGATSLVEKVASLCSVVAARTTAPSFKNTPFSSSDCLNPGSAAVEARGSAPLYFVGLDKPTPSAVDIVRVSGRTQVWLGRSLLGLAGLVSTAMEKWQGLKPGADMTAAITSDGAFADIVRPKITLLEAPKFDRDSLEGSAKINFSLNRLVLANHDILISTKVIDQKLVIAITTVGMKPFEESIISRGSAVMLIVPHTSDVYVDFLVNIDVNDPGFGNAILQKQLRQALGSGLNSVMHAANGL